RATLEQLAAKVKVARQTPASLVLLAKVLRALKAHAAALRLLEQAQAQYPADFWINEELAVALLLARPPRMAQAIGHFRVAAALRPRSPSPYVNLSFVLMNQNDWPEATAPANRSIALEPRNPPAYVLLGAGLYLQKNLPGAITAYKKAIEIAPGYAKAHYNLGLALEQSKDLPGAIAA